MKISKLTIALLIVILISASLWFMIFDFAKPYISELYVKQLTMEQKLEDFNYLYDTLKENYPFFEVKKRMSNYDWLAQKSEFENWIRNTKNNREFYAVLHRIVNLVQNAHTHILEGEFYQELKDIYEDPHAGYSPSRRDILNNEKALKMSKYWQRLNTSYNNYIPIIFRYVEGNYAVFDGNLEEYNIPKGSILKKVDDIDINEYIKSLNDKTYLYYDYKRNQQKLDELIIFTEPNQEVKLTLLTPMRNIMEVIVKEDYLNFDVYKRAYASEQDEKNFDLRIIEENRVAYIRLKSMMTPDGFSSQEDGKIIYDFLKKIEDYPYLIIDIRGNGGGSEGYWRNNLLAFLLQKHTYYDSHLLFKDSEYIKPFIADRYSLFDAKTTDQLPEGKNYPPEAKSDFKYFVTITNDVVPYNPVKFKGKIYLLVDGGVYSAAESFASFAKTTGWATLVGTTTGGDGVTADPALMMLPNSGIVVRFSSSMGLNPDGTANEEYHTQPDIYVEQTYIDFLRQVQPYGDINEYIGTTCDTALKYVLDIIENDK